MKFGTIPVVLLMAPKKYNKLIYFICILVKTIK